MGQKEVNTQLIINDDIKHLNLDILEDNIFYYDYNIRHLLKIQKSNMDEELPEYIGTFSSFVGEVYENVIYELLIRYAVTNDEITKFIVKGPHQNNQQNIKNGFLIDRKSQIVYKSGYKDISEFDGLFFTKDSVYFVESTIVKDTMSLRKRLKKKKSLLEILFPKLEVKALVIVSREAMGINVFPSYATVWITDVLNVSSILSRLKVLDKKNRKKFVSIEHDKMTEVYDLEVSNFKYFATLNWILRKLKSNKKHILDIEFLKSYEIERYFDIYTKIFVGFTRTKDFKKLHHNTSDSGLQEILKSKIEDDKFYIAIEKTHRGQFILVYFTKILNGKLKRIEIGKDKVSIANKDSKGFTFSEIKYLKYVFKPYHTLSDVNIKEVINLI
jgi:hypothetical protein